MTPTIADILTTLTSGKEALYALVNPFGVNTLPRQFVVEANMERDKLPRNSLQRRDVKQPLGIAVIELVSVVL